MQNKISKIINYFRTTEKYLLVFVLFMMITLACLQIVLRTFFKAINWFDTFLSYGVLWVGMLAAGIVTYEASHIKIDIVGRFTKGKVKEAVNVFTSFFSGIVSTAFMFIFFIYIFVVEYFSKSISGGPGSHKWMLLSILPIGFFIMSIRFLNRMLTYNVDLVGKRMMAIVNNLFGVILPLIILLLTFTTPNLSDETVYTAFNDKTMILMIRLLSILVSVSALIGLYYILLRKMNRVAYFISTFASIYYGFLCVLSVISLISITTASTVYNKMGSLTNTHINLLYLVPIVLFYFFHSSLLYPVSNYLFDLYPRVDHENSEVEA